MVGAIVGIQHVFAHGCQIAVAANSIPNVPAVLIHVFGISYAIIGAVFMKVLYLVVNPLSVIEFGH